MNSFTNRPKDINVNKPKEVKFGAILIVFIMGALSFSVAIAYNGFAKSVIEHFSLGDHLLGTFVNLIVFTVITILILRILWEKFPEEVEEVID